MRKSLAMAGVFVGALAAAPALADDPTFTKQSGAIAEGVTLRVQAELDFLPSEKNQSAITADFLLRTETPLGRVGVGFEGVGETRHNGDEFFSGEVGAGWQPTSEIALFATCDFDNETSALCEEKWDINGRLKVPVNDFWSLTLRGQRRWKEGDFDRDRLETTVLYENDGLEALAQTQVTWKGPDREEAWASLFELGYRAETIRFLVRAECENVLRSGINECTYGAGFKFNF